jgi:hypothetical protein
MNMLKGSVDANCLAGKGWKTKAPIINAHTIAIDSELPDNTEFPDLQMMLSHHSFLWGQDIGEESIQTAQSGRVPKAEESDEENCDRKPDQIIKSVETAFSGVGDEWSRQIKQVDNSTAVQAKLRAFSSCVERYGVPGQYAGSLDAFFGDYIQSLESSEDAAERRSTERHWVPIFATCSRPYVAVEMRMRGQARAAFLKSHYQEVTAAEAKILPAIAALKKLAGQAADSVSISD